MSAPPSLNALSNAIKHIKTRKAQGPDSAGVILHEAPKLLNNLMQVLLKIRETETFLSDFRVAIIQSLKF